MIKTNTKGVALYFVLAILLIVVILANIILSFITSQTRLTTHQVKRIQAYYAAQGAINFALEQLRVNNTSWVTTSSNRVRNIRICGPNFSTDPSCGTPNLTETDFPRSVHYIDLIIRYNDTNLQDIKQDVNATVNYTSL